MPCTKSVSAAFMLGAAFAGRGAYFFSHAGRILRKNSAV